MDHVLMDQLLTLEVKAVSNKLRHNLADAVLKDVYQEKARRAGGKEEREGIGNVEIFIFLATLAEKNLEGPSPKKCGHKWEENRALDEPFSGTWRCIERFSSRIENNAASTKKEGGQEGGLYKFQPVLWVHFVGILIILLNNSFY